MEQPPLNSENNLKLSTVKDQSEVLGEGKCIDIQKLLLNNKLLIMYVPCECFYSDKSILYLIIEVNKFVHSSCINMVHLAGQTIRPYTRLLTTEARLK